MFNFIKRVASSFANPSSNRKILFLDDADSKLKTKDSNGDLEEVSITSQQPWVKDGESEATSSTDVAVDDNIFHNGSVDINTDGNNYGLKITKDPTTQNTYSPALLVQDKEDTIYPPTRNTAILFEVRANNSPPVGRPLLSVQAEGAVRIWDYLTILPSQLTINQWFPESSMLQVGSDLSGVSGAVNIVVQNQRDSEPDAPGGHPFMKFVDMNTGAAGVVPGETRLYITGGGSLKYGEDNTSSPNLVPFWPGDAYSSRQSNFAVRNAVGQTGDDFGGLYSKFLAVQNDINFINVGGGVEPFVNRDSIDGSITINNEKKLQIYDGIKIGSKTGLDGTIESDYGGIKFVDTKIGYNVDPTYKIDINSDDDYPFRVLTPTSLLDFRQNLIFDSPGTTTSANTIGNLPTSTINLFSTNTEAENLGSSISFGTRDKLVSPNNTYLYAQIHGSKFGSASDYAGKLRFLTVAANSTSDYRLEINETNSVFNTSVQLSKQFATSGAGVSNGSIFYGTDGALYYKGGSGTVTLIGPA